jgi:mycothiol synthase
VVAAFGGASGRLEHCGVRLESRHVVPDTARGDIAELLQQIDSAIRVSGQGDLTTATVLLDDALAKVTAAGGGDFSLWVSRPTPDHDALARLVGLTQSRDIFQMRRPLPADDPPAGFVTRPFRVGEDEEAWLTVNNRAFAGHPDQSAWDRDLLRQRMAEPWFDPNGFLLHERDSRVAGFCWTKIHDTTVPPLGEIYVIAVDPDFTGLGLGRALTLAGLSWLHRQGLGAGMLYVDAANAPALGLYRDLGFTVDHVDRGYHRSAIS